LKILAALLALLYYAVIVFSSGVLLAGAQLRSSTGAALDTWRLNYESNRALNETLTQNLKTANTKLRNDLDI